MGRKEISGFLFSQAWPPFDSFGSAVITLLILQSSLNVSTRCSARHVAYSCAVLRDLIFGISRISVIFMRLLSVEDEGGTRLTGAYFKALSQQVLQHGFSGLKPHEDHLAIVLSVIVRMAISTTTHTSCTEMVRRSRCEIEVSRM